MVFLLLLAGFQRIFVSLIRFKGRAQFWNTRQKPLRNPCRIRFKESASMDPITIRIIAGVLFVVIVAIIVWRRKKMASKRKPLP
ncbi:MAG: hypothetical protein AUI53_04565 [Acidobacteria bacterium 13_1_40CM_2_60_7]|nr:MAG: hypothetical protein AUI53_04565 [Acidobacteria bacterium 13_1_40CM_2_60_7]